MRQTRTTEPSRISLRHRLLTINLFSLAVALGLAVLWLGIGGFQGWRNDEVAELRQHARLAGSLLGEAVRDNDASAVQNVLKLLEVVPELVFAEVYDADGAVLAHYQRPDEPGAWIWSDLPQAMDPQSSGYYWQFVEISEPIRIGPHPAGSFYLVADLGKLYSSLFRYLGINTAGAVFGLVCCIFLIHRLQRGVTEPLHRLLELVHRVARQRDYASRAATPEIAELAELAQAFNDMLGQVQQRDAELQRELEERKLAEFRFRYVADHAPVMIWMTDRQRRCTFVNQVWLDFTGLSAAESVGPHWQQVIHPDDLQSAFRDYYPVQPSANGAISTEYRLRRHDGVYRWMLDTGLPLFDGSGGFAGYIGSCIDITERKQAEAELRLAATTFQTNEAIVITDAEGSILRVNHAFCTITGYSPEEVLGKNPRLLQSHRHDRSFYRQLWQKIRRSGYWKGEIWNRRKSGEIYPELLSITAVQNERGSVTHYVGTFSDITQAKKTEAEIRHLAFYDPLTQLPNRRLLLDRLNQAIPAAHRSGHHGALLFIDLDNFKTLNDTLGHSVGDRLLEKVAGRLRESIRTEDTVARLGGDEFVVLLSNLSQNQVAAAKEAEAVAEKICTRLNQIFDLGEFMHYVSSSVGVTLFGSPFASSDEVLKQADMAMYRAKSAGRNTVRFFETGMQEVLNQRLQLETELRQALANHEFRLHLQPQFDHARRLIGAEALLRWENPAQGLVAPAHFIPLAEENGLIIPIGHWVLQSAGELLREWSSRYRLEEFRLAVNVSSRQFRQTNFAGQVRELIERTGADPLRIKLEITESAVLDNLQDANRKMESLRHLGVIFSIDDFGTGYSSLSYLKSLPIDELKIDKSFVQDILTNEQSAVIVRTIIAMSQQLKLKTVAEGVEHAEQVELLANYGCQAFQGYYLGRPLPVREFEQWLAPGTAGEAPAAPAHIAPRI